MKPITKLTELFGWCQENRIFVTINRTEAELMLLAVMPDGWIIRRDAKLSSDDQVKFEVRCFHEDLEAELLKHSKSIDRLVKRIQEDTTELQRLVKEACTDCPCVMDGKAIKNNL